MKKLGILAVLLSLGLFTLGCTQAETEAPATNGTAPMDEPAPAPADEPAPVEEPAPADDLE